MEPKFIRIRGARMHNLKNIDVDLPRNAFIVFTGLSGSGKSTLAFDTLYAEGQRRYVESLSTYARQFLGQMEKPDVDLLDGLSPAVSIEQRTTSRNPRSTVGTITEIYDYLRLLFARVGQPFCPVCGEAIKPQSIQDMVAALMREQEGTKIILLAPLVEGRKGEHRELFRSLRKDGYVRVRVNGYVRSLDEEIILEKNKRHSIEAVVDRVVIKENSARRVSDSVATAVRLSDGLLLVSFPDSKKETLFSEKAACVKCGRSLPDLSPQLFSFNNPKGACSECGGIGVKQFFDPDLVVPDPSLSIQKGAVAPWSRGSFSAYSYTGQMLQALADNFGFSLKTPFADLSSEARNIVLYGTNGKEVHYDYKRHNRRLTYKAPFEGVLPNLARRYMETSSAMIREDLERFMNEQPCPGCKGARLKEDALCVRIGARNIHEMTLLSVEQLLAGIQTLEFSAQEKIIADRVIKEIGDRLSFLADVGLGYLSLERRASTLSGGEAQRIRLASQIGSRLAGVLYILDEPSIGLHQRDNQRLIKTLTNLRDLGNTVLVVEHDGETIRASDHVLDMGPGAGVHGGDIIFSGPVADLLSSEDSLTGGYLSGRLKIATPKKRKKPLKWITIEQASQNNLKNINVKLPVGVMTCVTGVSGSGKSSLVVETLYRGVINHFRKNEALSGCKAIKGLNVIDKVIDIDQSPIGRTPRSNPATYTGVLTPVRELFSRLPEARARGYKPGRFSFNIKGGRCETCEGEGVIKIAMHFLPDVYVTCETCAGKRYNHETLEIRYKGKSISDILGMTVEEALVFFGNVPPIKNRLQSVNDVGLSYITLGQSSVTLSGGEAQRIKLAKELGKRSTGRTLYILDEPTTGLHPDDIKHLLYVLTSLVDKGNTVIIIEHNLDVVKTADYIVDLGPEGGDGGGSIVVAGTPEQVAENKNSYTGMYLKNLV